MIRPNHRIMLAVHLVKPDFLTHKVNPAIKLCIAVLFACARDHPERLAVKDVHVRHGARRVVLPTNPLDVGPIQQRLFSERQVLAALLVGLGQ